MKTNLLSVKLTHSIPRQVIAERAYAIWLARGRPPGCDYDHWVEAEQQLLGDQPPTDESLASRLTGWGDVLGTDIDRALDSFGPNFAPRSATSL